MMMRLETNKLKKTANVFSTQTRVLSCKHPFAHSRGAVFQMETTIQTTNNTFNGKEMRIQMIGSRRNLESKSVAWMSLLMKTKTL